MNFFSSGLLYLQKCIFMFKTFTCKHKYALLQMKEASNQKVQEKKPLLKFKIYVSGKNLENKLFRACLQRTLFMQAIDIVDLLHSSAWVANGKKDREGP